MQPFVWKKKEEKSKESEKYEDEDSKRLNFLQEIERVRKRREDREKELEEMERLRFEEQRLREAATYGDWKEKEEQFLSEQIRVRSVIRILENRDATIDRLVKNIILSDSIKPENEREDEEVKRKLSQLDIEHSDPLEIIHNTEIRELNQLLEDVSSYIELERTLSSVNIQYFEAIYKIIVSEIAKTSSANNSKSFHKSIEKEVVSIISDKSSDELDNLERDIIKSINENKIGDREYWEAMLKEVQLQRSKQYVKDRHADIIRDYVNHISQLHVINKKNIEKETVVKSQDNNLDNSKIAIDLLRNEQCKGLDIDEGLLKGDEVQLTKTYAWSDRYRPRKPIYYNRVRTGYDWNKYNCTHYDRDNPPPRMIQGYKFTIFYPDLVDILKTPKYYLEPTDDPDFVIIRFHAGAPYEDIAFKIVNRQWDTQPYYGFKCSFERGILNLFVNFRRQFYRR